MMFADLQRETMEMQQEYNDKMLRDSPEFDPKADISPLEPRAEANGNAHFNDVGISLIIPENHQDRTVVNDDY